MVHQILELIFSPIHPDEINTDIYTYSEPILNEDGSCPIIKEVGLTYDIRKHAPSHDRIKLLEDLLIRLNRVVKYVHEETGVFWFGIYPKVNDKLVKFAYQGEISRAVFPLTEEFRNKSTNTWVALNKETRYIPDVEKEEGPYYRCDAKVKSELCTPLLSSAGDLLGIYDAEDIQPHFFDKHHDFFTAIKQSISTLLEHHPIINRLQ